MQADQTPAIKQFREVIIPDTITVSELANRMTERTADIVRELMKNGIMATATEVIDGETAELITTEFGHKPKRVSESDVELDLTIQEDNPENLSFLMKVIYSQQKPNIVIRSSSILGKILFFLRFNTATQFGITFALVILFTFLNKELIIYPIIVMIFSQIFFSLAVIFGSLVKRNLK